MRKNIILFIIILTVLSFGCKNSLEDTVLEVKKVGGVEYTLYEKSNTWSVTATNNSMIKDKVVVILNSIKDKSGTKHIVSSIEKDSFKNTSAKEVVISNREIILRKDAFCFDTKNENFVLTLDYEVNSSYEIDSILNEQNNLVNISQSVGKIFKLTDIGSGQYSISNIDGDFYGNYLKIGGNYLGSPITEYSNNTQFEFRYNGKVKVVFDNSITAIGDNAKLIPNSYVNRVSYVKIPSTIKTIGANATIIKGLRLDGEIDCSSMKQKDKTNTPEGDSYSWYEGWVNSECAHLVKWGK